MTALSEALRALSPQREAQFQFSASVRGGVVPDWREQFSGFFGGASGRTGPSHNGTRKRDAVAVPLIATSCGATQRVTNPAASTLHAGQAQQDGPPQPPQVCPASFTQNARDVGGREHHGPLSEGEQYAAEQCADGRAYVFDGRGFLAD